ncbi:MAG: Uncharacterized protein G01um101444_441 [Parcubacteria group bacterium Gr01-1014_44]|nr:MAG: Uncharacterized protein G01um101444_441 [Parcubacteria group bacterium Gr01-1014_44]
MERVLTIVQILISVFLVASILLQQKGSGLGSSFGGGDGANAYSTRRGTEKVLFYSTIVLALSFLAIALIRIRL